jgi:hypothetical protein
MVTTAAERQRRYRARQAKGARYFRLMASETDVWELLVREGYLRIEDADDREWVDRSLSLWFWEYCRKRNV